MTARIGFFLLHIGDSGYGQQPWLFAPILEPESAADELYNVSHKKTRHQVERCIGAWKSRFRCLCKQRVLMYSPATSGSIITACAVLHNIMVDAKYPLPPEAEIADEMDDEDIDVVHIIENGPIAIRNAGFLARANLVGEFF